MKKRFAAFLSALLLGICLTACAGDGSSEPTCPDNGTETATEVTRGTEAGATEAETTSAQVPSDTITDWETEPATTAPNPADGPNWTPFA